MKLSNTTTPSPCFIIAEAGVNHNGSLEKALELVDAAKRAGADAVKFQTFIAEEEISQFAPKAEYQKNSTSAEESQLDMVRKLELDRSQHEELIARCRESEILFLSSAFELKSIALLRDLGMPLFKVPSGEITNLPYLRAIGQCGKPVILSTGMSIMDEIQAALDVLTNEGVPLEQITVLHCNTEYPTPMQDVNLRAMCTIRDTFGVRVGYSDHTLGIEVSLAAVALGATVIEKHLTMDCTLPGPDHSASSEPGEFKAMVESIRNLELAMGNGIKQPSPSESKNIPIARKSIVAACDIEANEILSEANLTAKRPGTGISPMQWDRVVNTSAKRSFKKDEMIEL